MARLAYERVHRVRGNRLIPSYCVFDVSQYRTYGVVSYGDALAEFLEPGHGSLQPHVPRDTLLWSLSLFKVEFCYLSRSQIQYSFERRIRFERGTRSRRGYLVPYRHVEFEWLRNDVMSTLYVALPSWWDRVEVPRGCFAEIPPSLYYIGYR